MKSSRVTLRHPRLARVFPAVALLPVPGSPMEAADKAAEGQAAAEASHKKALAE